MESDFRKQPRFSGDLSPQLKVSAVRFRSSIKLDVRFISGYDKIKGLRFRGMIPKLGNSDIPVWAVISSIIVI